MGRHNPQKWVTFQSASTYATTNQDIANQVLEKGESLNKYSMNETINAWNITVDYALTGENNVFLNQGIKPRHNFDPFEGEWGSWVLAARFSPINFDQATFKNIGTAEKPIYPFADPRSSVSSAATWALGANWWLNPNVKLMFDYSQTSFEGGAAELDENNLRTTKVIDRDTEKVFQTRIQLGF